MTTIPASLRFRTATALVVVLIGVLVWYVAQPRYDGRTAREWFDDALQSDGMAAASMGGPRVETGRFLECADAFRHMGNRGIRLVVRKYVRQTPIYLEWYDKVAVALKSVVRLPPRRQLSFSPESIVAHRLLLRIGRVAAPELIRRTRSPRPEERAMAVTVLGELGPGNPEAQACLLRMLGDASTRVIYGSLEVLWMTLPEPETVIPVVTPFLTNANGRVRIEASYVIGCVPPVHEPGFGTLLTLLSDSEDIVRANAARAIGLSGLRSEPILAALEARLDDSNAVTRFRAAEALGRLGGPDATNRTVRLLEVITEAERSSREYFRLVGFNARTALGQAEPESGPMIDTFQQLLTNAAPYVRSEAVESLVFHYKTCGTPPPPAIRTLLVSAQQDPNGLVRQQAIRALSKWP